MKKNVLALSIAAMIGGLGFAGAASAALTVAESGAGHILLTPYYTAQNGNMTVLHVVNTDTVNGKAMKVRFRGASNSDDVLDFQVFMSPGDVWTAAISQSADGVAKMVTADGTCTLPAIAKGQDVNFVTDRLPTAMSPVDKQSNTREGYVEIFNMADISGASTFTVGGLTNQKSALFTATKHVNGVAPCTSSVLNGTLTTGAGTAGLVPPTTGLTGTWYIFNIPQTTSFSGSMTAIASNAATNNVFSPQQQGNSTLASSDPLFNAGVLAKQQYDMPDLSTPYDAAYTTAAAQALALTSTLAATSVINQYANDPLISAKTDWVFSQPTRRYSIAANYANPIGQGVARVTGELPAAATVTYEGAATGATAYRYINTDVNSFFDVTANTSVNTIGQICSDAASQVFYDREESSQTSGAVFSPGQVSRTRLCGEVSVLSFADAGASVLGGAVARVNVTGVYTNGWGVLNFATPGIPVIGGSFMKLSNPGVLPGVAGNFGIMWPHTKTK